MRESYGIRTVYLLLDLVGWLPQALAVIHREVITVTPTSV